MAKVTYTPINDAVIKRTLAGRNGIVERELALRGQWIANEAKRRAPVDNGTLRNSITWELGRKGSKLIVRVGTNLKYARYVHDGTGIYGPRGQPIRPVRASVLRWPAKGGGFVFAREVKGSPGRPFLRDALYAGMRHFKRTRA